MDNNGHMAISVSPLIRKSKPLRQLEVKLDGRTLELSIKGIKNCDINLGTVECPILRIQFPRGTKIVECKTELRLRVIPRFY